MIDTRAAIYADIDAERQRHDDRWGPAPERNLTLTVWLTVLVEEVGEVAQDILKHRRETLRGELVQVAAVASAMIECLDSAAWGVNDCDAG